MCSGKCSGKYARYWDAYGAEVGVNAGAYQNGIPEPKISAGMHRHVLELSDAEQQDDKHYYQKAPCNYYSYFLHYRALARKCYGFPYDDFANGSSFLEHADITWVAVAVGF